MIESGSRFCIECGMDLTAASNDSGMNMETHETAYQTNQAQNNTWGNAVPNPGGSISADSVPNTEKPVTRKRSGGMKSFGIGFLRIVIWMVVIAIIAAASNYFHQHSSALTKGKTIDLMETVKETGEEPIGEFVSMEAVVLSSFATEENTLNEMTTSKDTYYVIMREDYGIMGVKVGDSNDTARLEKGVDDFLAVVMGESENLDRVPIEGKLEKFDSPKLQGFYDEVVDELGLSDDEEITILYEVIDMTELRSDKVVLFILIPVLAIGAVIFAVITAHRNKKKKNAAGNTPFGV